MCINLALLMEKQVIYVECFLQLRMSVQPSGTFTCSRKSLANELAHNRGARGPALCCFYVVVKLNYVEATNNLKFFLFQSNLDVSQSVFRF